MADASIELPGKQSPTILLVDDDAGSLVMLEAVLGIKGDWSFITASSGFEALELLRDTEPAVIVLDVHMPGMDGYELAERLKQDSATKDIPIIFLTGSADASGVGRGYESGAVDYMVKPFDPDVLRSKISVFVDLWEKTQQLQELAELRRLKELAELRVEAEARYRTLVNAMPQMAWLTDAQGDIYYFNQRWYEYTGLTKEESLEKGPAVATHPEDLVQSTFNWRRALAEGAVFEHEHRLRRADGCYRWHLVRALPTQDDQGKITDWVGTMTDIDDQKLAEAELAAQYAVATILAEAETTEIAAPRLLAAVGEYLDFPLVALWTKDGSDLICRDHWAQPDLTEESVRAMTSARLPIAGSLAGETFASGTARWIENLEHDSLFIRQQPEGEPFRSWVSFPLVVDDELIGIIECFSAEVRLRNDGLLSILEALGAQIGQFVERKSVEEALRTSEELKSAILSASLDCIITIDHRGLVTEWNLAAEVIFGYKREEAIAQEMAALIIPEKYRSSHREGLARYLETGEARIMGQRLELPALRKDGSEFPAELTITRVHLPGRPPTFTGFLRDITTRKEAEEQIKAAERRYRALVEQLPMATYTVAADGNITYISPQIKQIADWSAEEAVGIDEFWFDRLHPEDRTRVPEAWKAWRETGMEGPFSIEYRLNHRDGHYVWVADQALPISDEDGEPLYFQGYILDVSERKAAEEERVRLYDAERAARELAEWSAERLRRLEAVTQAGLATLDLEQLLSELLRRIRDLLETDTVAVLLVETETNELVARAALGFEEEVEQGVRVPLGKGFAGRVAAEVRPVAISDVSTADIVNPLIKKKGIQSLLGVPLRVEDRVIGVLHVGTFASRWFTEEEKVLLQLAGDRVALAIEQRRLYEAEKTAREEAERRQRQLSLLARTSEILASSLDYELTLSNVAHAIVPNFADWCVVYFLEDNGSVRQLVVAHSDPSQERWASEFSESYSPDLEAESGVGYVIRTSSPELVSEISPSMYSAFAGGDQQRLELLERLQLRSYMGVPLIAHGRTIGALAFLTTESSRHYTADDLSLAEELARRAGVAIDNARLYHDRNAVARTLEDSLLPPSLPRIPGVEVAATYQPAAGRPIGGDFYDLFDLGSGSWLAVIGDVVGKGAPAAAMTSLARHTMRTAARYDPDPQQILEVLNDAIIHGAPEEGQFCTIVCARLTPMEGKLHIELADGGHPVPFLIRGSKVERVDVTGMPLGMWPRLDVGVKELTLEPGDKLVFYTDGVIEARFEGELYGEDRLRAFLEDNTDLEANQLAARIELEAITFQDANVHDDIAVMVIEAGGDEASHTTLRNAPRGSVVPRIDIRLEPTPRSVAVARHAVESMDEHLSEDQMATAQLLISEAVSNAVKYSFGEDVNSWIGFNVEVQQTTMRVEVTDAGLGFDPEFDVQDLNAESGRGLFLVDSLSSRWGVERGARNKVWFELALEPGSPTI